MVAHCGKSVAGSHAHSLVLTDIASGWTKATAMVVREQTLVTFTVEEVRATLPFPMLGLEVDNDSALQYSTTVSLMKGMFVSSSIERSSWPLVQHEADDPHAEAEPNK